ncbi:MAG: glycoside hydrolase family 16 protein [Eubacterium sp.]|nr:glycoside hydrolase family 16 protein [Eubacterium sp.]
MKERVWNKTLAIVMAMVMVIGSVTVALPNGSTVNAATTVITSMDYYDGANGPTLAKTGVAPVSFGIVMPKFNGVSYQQVSLTDVEKDLQLYVKQTNGTGGEWKTIESMKYFVFNDTWGWEYQQWTKDVGGWILWMKLEETTQLRFHGKTNGVDLDYTFTLNELPKTELTSISTREGSIVADATGGSATHWGEWSFNGGGVVYDQVKDDITIKVDNGDGKGFVNLMGNASSGFIWDTNFGIYTDGTGGLWFQGIDHSFTIRLQKKSDPSIYADAVVTYNAPVRNNYLLSSYDGKVQYDAKESTTGAVGFPLPKIGGTEVRKSDLDMFSYEVYAGGTYQNGQWTGGTWTILNDIAASGFIYQGNGFNQYSNSQQWGYFIDHVYGLWFQPVRKDTYFRVGYPKNGQKGGATEDNYVYYTILGNSDVPSQTTEDMKDIAVDDQMNSSGFTPEGWKMIWNDEFSGSTLDAGKWNVIEGYLLEEDDIATAGWGNQELEYYSKDNVSVGDGALKIHMKKQKKTFYEKGSQTKSATASYSSGKLTTQNNFSVKYGRVDVRAKLPAGEGIWPAMWMLPNDNLYGGWAYSGEIDIAEGRGRVPNKIFGAMHYGAAWPNNINSSDLLDLVEDGNKKTDTTDWHVYSVIWEENDIKIYCDGKCFFKCTNNEWYSGSDRGNKNAPFDQRFFIILNLACGGSFDSFHAPGNDFTGADMQVDYVRVYQRMVSANAEEKPDTNPKFKTNGVDDNLFGDYQLKTTQSQGEQTTAPVIVTTEVQTSEEKITNKKPPVTKSVEEQVKEFQKKCGVAKVKKAFKKKKSAKKVKVILKKKVTAADGLIVRFYRKKKDARKNRKWVKEFTVKKNVKSFTVKNKKLKAKTLFVRVRGYKVIQGKMYFAKKWSVTKKVKNQ